VSSWVTIAVQRVEKGPWDRLAVFSIADATQACLSSTAWAWVSRWSRQQFGNYIAVQVSYGA